MVLRLAKDAVEKKLEMKASVLVGNYEFYYACGKLSAKTELKADESCAPLELKELVEEALTHFTPEEGNEEDAYLAKLLKRYRPGGDYDSQMADLFVWGKTGEEPEEG